MPSAASAPIRRIVIGVDGSPNSRLAAAWAARLATAAGAEVVAVHALGLLERLGRGSDPEPVENLVPEIQELFANEWCAPLSEAGAACRRELRFGPPVQVLLDVAEAEDADLIVVGSRGLGGASALLLGSTSSRLANSSSRPVLIVPLPKED